MGTLKRVSRSVNASPNQFATVSDATRPIGLMGYRLTHTNTADSWVHFYNNTSGTVTVGTTSPHYGSVLLPAATSPNASQVYVRIPDDQDPLQWFDSAITIAATTTQTGNTSPSSNVTVELFYSA